MKSRVRLICLLCSLLGATVACGDASDGPERDARPEDRDAGTSGGDGGDGGQPADGTQDAAPASDAGDHSPPDAASPPDESDAAARPDAAADPDPDPAPDPDPVPSRCDGYVPREVQPATDPPPLERLAGALTDWGTYQANRSHSGAVSISVDEADFAPRWRYEDSAVSVGPVTVQGSRVVFASQSLAVWCLDAFSGELSWSADFSTRDYISPPAIAGDKVYVQTAGHENSFLWALDAATGARRFQVPYESQRSAYYAPTVDGGSVYVAGGSYGGMYAFDAETGARRWFVKLNQYDRFTPTVTDEHVFAYTGKNSPQVTIVDRQSGAIEAAIADPNFEWNGGSMDTVAVADSGGGSIAIHDGRLLRFDHAAEMISWERAESFVGQPALDRGSIYTINAGALDVRSEATGERMWSWTPSTEGALTGRLLVTESHVFARTASETIAISTQTRQKVWSHPVAGELSLAQGALFIAAGNTLVAIDLLGDQDDDGLPDAWEAYNEGEFDPAVDQDGDGLSNGEEYALGSNPRARDSDGDTLNDGDEAVNGTDPLDVDSDLDLLSDGAELATHCTDPLSDDTDDDGIDDAAEVGASLDPRNPGDAALDNDHDGYDNLHEVYAGTDRRDRTSYPRIDDWGMFLGNARHDGYRPALLDPSNFGLRWSRTLPSVSAYGAAVGAGRVFLTLSGTTKRGTTTIALDAGTGEPDWSFAFASVSTFPIISVSSPSYADGLVYVHTGDFENTALWALDAETGARVFRATHNPGWPDYAQPTISDGNAYLAAGNSTGFLSLNATTGAQRWAVAPPRVDYLELAVRGTHLYTPDKGGALLVLDGVTGAVDATISGSLPLMTPVLGGRDDVLFGGAFVSCVDLTLGKMAWSSLHAGQGRFGFPAVGNGKVFAVRDGILEVFNEVSGRRVWTWQPSGDALSSNVIVTISHVFVASARATYAVDLRTHAVWSHPIGGTTIALGNEGALFVVSDTGVAAIEVEGDPDADGLPQWWERNHGGDLEPTADADEDGRNGHEEFEGRTDPRAADTDRDGLDDGEEYALATDPLKPDSDADGLDDLEEHTVYGSDPNEEDSDGDGIDDGTEARAGLDPLDPDDAARDDDHDGYSNMHEVFAGSNHEAAGSIPRLSPWGMVQGNASHNGYQPALIAASRIQSRWAVTLSAPASAAAISANRVFVTSGTQLVALDAATGAEAWRYTFPTRSSSSLAISAPSLANDLVYVHTGGGAQETALWAFDPNDGSFAFSGKHGGQMPRFSAPTIYGSRAFVNGGTYGGIVAHDALVGTMLWSAVAPWEDYWEPAVDGQFVYSVQAGNLQGLAHSSGMPLFTIEASVPIQTPVLSQRGLAIVAGPNLVAIDVANRREAWRSVLAGPGNFALPAVGNGRVFGLRDGLIEVFSEVSGERLWAYRPENDILTSNLVLTATHLFVASSTRTYAVDLQSRTQAWSHPHGGMLALGPEGALVIVSGTRIEVLATH